MARWQVRAMTDDVWSEYKRTGDRRLREQLILRYTPLVRYVASRVAWHLPQSIEQNDLISYGLFGLIDAIEKFDVSRATKFEAYAIVRVRGAMIDELRSIDWVPRSVRAKARAVEQASAALELSLGRLPTDAEMAAYLGLPEAEMQKTFNQISYVGVAALDEGVAGWYDRGEVVTVGDTIPDREQAPLRLAEVEEMRQMLVETIGHLSTRERVVLTLYYYENLTLAQVGEVLGVTESRVCQIHTKAISRLQGVTSLLSSA
jgi:RNA polymerase sigma factor for flagellar operon FliA